MQKLYVLLSFLLLTYGGLYGQTVPYKLSGSYIDSYGQLIDEHADQDYTPFKSLNVSFNSQIEFTPGVLYPASGNSERGKILYVPGNRSFSFKKYGNSKKEKIDLFSGLSMTIGADSFVVANGFSVYGKVGLVESFVQELQILQYLGKTDKFAFYRYVPAFGSPNIVVQILGTQEFVSLPLSKKELYTVSEGLFFDYPQLLDFLENRELKNETMLSLIRFIQFTDAIQEQKSIRYTASWEITDNPAKAFYYAEVSQSIQNWILDFYNKSGQKLFTEHYAYAEAAVKDGEAIWYYPESGVVRKKTHFEKGKPSNFFQTFHPNGALHYSYTVTSFGRTEFKGVYNPEGQPVLDIGGNGIEVFFDQTANRSITREFKNYELESSWYTDDRNRRIYQVAKRNSKLRNLKSVNTRLGESDNYPERDIVNGAEGIVLVKVVISPENKIESYEILQMPSESIGRKAKAIVSSLEFRSGKHGKEKIYQEAIIPIRFSLLRQSINRYPYQNLFWLHQHMHMQQMHQMNMQNLPTPPSIPRF